MKDSTRTPRTTITISPETADKFRKAADEHGMSITTMMDRLAFWFCQKPISTRENILRTKVSA